VNKEPFGISEVLYFCVYKYNTQTENI